MPRPTLPPARRCSPRQARPTILSPLASAAAAVLAGVALPAQAGMLVTFEPPGRALPDMAALCAGAADCVLGLEGFDSLKRGKARSFTTDFGTGGRITGRYTGADVVKANRYGGAGGTGQHVETFSATGFTVELATDGVPGVNYFGFWLSALDRGNQLEFWRGSERIFSFGPQQFIDLVAGCPSAFCGNPFAPFDGKNAHEPYAFLNFRLSDGFFDRVHFFQDRPGGYESDNHMVGFVQGMSGSPIPAPATLWLGLLAMAALAARERLRRARGIRAG
jgi:hypothetical protein